MCFKKEQKDRVHTRDSHSKMTVRTENIRVQACKELGTKWKLLLIVASVFTGIFSVGFGFSLGVLYAELVRVFQVSRALVAMIQSIHMGLVLGSAILWNHPFRQYGPGLCIIVGSVAFSSSIFISVFSVNIEMFICFLGVTAGLSGSILNLGPYLIMGKLCHNQRTAVLAILTCGGSIGQIALTYILEKLIEVYNWSGALLIVSGLAMNTIPCCLLLHVKTVSVARLEENADENKLIKPFMFKNWRFILLLVVSFVFTASMLAESKFLVDLTLIKGFDFETGTLFASLIGVTNLIGRVSGAVVNFLKSGRSLLYLSGSVLIAGGAHILILLSGDYYGLLFGALLSGLSLGFGVSQLLVIMMDIFQLHHFAAAVVFWNLVGGIGNAFGGYIGGIIPDLTGSYALVFELSAIGCLFNSVCFLVIYLSIYRDRKRREYTQF